MVTRFDVAELFHDLLTQAGIMNADRGLQLVWDIPSSQCVLAHDRNKIHTIAYHLVNNAIKFTPVGRVEVCVETPDAGGVVLIVRDTGIGFPAPRVCTAAILRPSVRDMS